MLFRKLTKTLEEFLVSHPDKILLINGARQVGKSYLVRYVCKILFKNYVEINLKEDQEGHQIFSTVGSTDDFYLQLGVALAQTPSVPALSSCRRSPGSRKDIQ